MATTELEDALAQLATIEAGIEGVVEAHDRLPESIIAMPCFVNYDLSGEAQFPGVGEIIDLITVVAELHVARGILSEADAIMRPFTTRFVNAIRDDVTWGGKVTTTNAIRWRKVQFGEGDTLNVGYRFEIDIKLRRHYP